MAETGTKLHEQPEAAPQNTQPEAGKQQQVQSRPCPKDCRRCSMAQQICCASMLSFQMYDVMNIVIQRLDAQQQSIEGLSERLNAIQSSEGELSAPLPIQPDFLPTD